MPGKQQNGIFQFAFAILQGALPETNDREGGSDYDRRNQQHAAQDQPVQRISLQRKAADAFSEEFALHRPTPGGQNYNA
jgi:hypothetical protein